MSNQIKSKKLATFLGLAAIAGVTQSSTIALAATDACSTSNPNSINVGNDVCEITFLTSPSSNFEVPEGVSALQALLVGGGSGANPSYTGGGGEVKIVDLATSGDVSIDVATAAGIGENGKPSKVSQAGTDYIANGGLLNDGLTGASGAGGPSGLDKGNNSIGDIDGNNANQPELNGGAGLVVKDIDGAKLFSDVEDCFGGGGAAGNYISNGDDVLGAWIGIASCGGGTTSVNIGTNVITPVVPLANSGGGAGGFPTWTVGREGSSGRVVLRYTLDSNDSVLADTGSSNSVLPMIAGLMLVAGGAVVLRRRSK